MWSLRERPFTFVRLDDVPVMTCMEWSPRQFALGVLPAVAQSSSALESKARYNGTFFLSFSALM